MTEIKQYLRSLKVFEGSRPTFDARSAPARPDLLFVDWLKQAVTAGVREPHAMTLSTLGLDGHPTARVLILKNVDENGWQFAVHAGSPKGRELLVHPAAALTFHWREQARQIRVRGRVFAASSQESAADFLARPAGSRAESLIGRQSQPLAGPEDLDRASKECREQVDQQPDLVDPAWTLYTLEAGSVEFWQGDQERKHVRLHFVRSENGWEKGLLWP